MTFRITTGCSAERASAMENSEAIRNLARTLKMPEFESYDKHVTPEMTVEDALLDLMSREVERRGQALIKKRIREAGIPNGYTMDTFKIVPTVPNLKEENVRALKTCRFIENKQNVCALGGGGTGKTHLMAAVGLAAIEMGYTVRFIRVSDMLTAFTEACTEKRLGAMIKTFMKVDLLLLDELGYVSLTVKKAQFLFDIIAKRAEAGAGVYVTSNYEFSKWPQFMGDPVMTKAMVGKLAGNSIILNMNGEDYRLAYKKT